MHSQAPAIAPSPAGLLCRGCSAARQLGVAACYATRCCIFHASTSPARLHRDATVVGAHAGYRGLTQRPQGKACHPAVNGLVAMRLARGATRASVRRTRAMGAHRLRVRPSPIASKGANAAYRCGEEMQSIARASTAESPRAAKQARRTPAPMAGRLWRCLSLRYSTPADRAQGPRSRLNRCCSAQSLRWPRHPRVHCPDPRRVP